MTFRTIRLHDIANARSGDKGNRLNIALVCRDPAHYPAVARQVTAEVVAQKYCVFFLFASTGISGIYVLCR